MRADVDLDGWYAGRTVVVTGGYGYLGSGLCARVRKAGARLRRGTRGRLEAEGDAEAWVGDLANREFAERLVDGADAVFHLAGQTSIKVSHDDPLGDLHANVASTLSLLDACARAGRKPAFVYSGTATEVGLTESVPIRPGTIDQPITVYDANKLAAEQLVGTYTAARAVHGVTLRIANVFGPGGEKSAPDRGVTNKMIARALAGGSLTYFGDGLLMRDYIYVDDLLEAFFRAAVMATRATSRSYVASSGKGYTLRDAFELIADVVAELGRPRVDVVSAPWPVATHPIDRRSFVSDIEGLASFLGWRPSISLRDGIRATARAFIEADADSVQRR
jgi:nucleoside-diphosphate-sugar epimerase